MVSRSTGWRGAVRRVPSVRAVLVLSFLVTVVMSIAAVAVLLDLRQKELKHAKAEILTLTRILSDQTTRTFEGVVLTMRVARERLSDDLGMGLELDSMPVAFLLKARSSGLPQIKSLFLIDSDGFGVNSSRADFIPRLPMASRTFFRYFQDGGDDEIFVSRPEKARVDGQWTFYMSMRLRDSGGKLRGVLVAAMSIEFFEALYDSIELDFVSRILLLNRDGTLLAGKPHDEELFAGTAVSRGAATAFERWPEGGAVEAREGTAERPRLAAYRPVSKFPLMVSASLEESEALTPWRQVARPIIAGLILALSLLWATTGLIVRNLVRKDTLASELRARDEQLRQMVQSVKDAIVTVNSAGYVVLFNRAAERMFGVRSDEAMGHPFKNLLSRCTSPAQLAGLMQHMDKARTAPVGTDVLEVIELQSGKKDIPVELSLSSATVFGETQLNAVFRDLTESQRFERELLDSNRQLQELSRSLQNVREEQRMRISRELHDELGQLLTGIRLEVSWLAGRMPVEQLELTDKIASIKHQIDQTIASVRRISSELRPLVLDDLGLSAAINWYVDQFSTRTGIAVELTLPPDDPPRGDAVATTLFRVLQESMTNIARHAEAKQVEIKLNFKNDLWVLSVRDDGIGFEFDAGRQGDIGLVGMRERAQALGGNLCLQTMPGRGTLVEVSIPAAVGREEG